MICPSLIKTGIKHYKLQTQIKHCKLKTGIYQYIPWQRHGSYASLAQRVSPIRVICRVTCHTGGSVTATTWFFHFRQSITKIKPSPSSFTLLVAPPNILLDPFHHSFKIQHIRLFQKYFEIG